jgi:preprotein translocase subunit SecD
MSKKKATILLSMLSIVIAAILVFTFIQFPINEKDSYVGAVGGIQLDYDMEGGVAYTLTLSQDNTEEVEDIEDVVNTLKYRIEALGYSAFTIKTLENSDPEILDKDIRIELKNNYQYIEQDIEVIAAYGELKFFGGSDTQDPTTQILKDMDAVADSQYLGMYGENNYGISIVLTSEAKQALVDEIKSASGSYQLKITCGEDEQGQPKTLFNASIEEDAFQGNAIGISNITTEQEAHRLALQVRSGGLAYKYNYESQTITSIYGEDIAVKSMIAVITMILVLMILFVVIYKGLGIITSLATLLFILGVTWLMIGVPGIVVSMGGLAGIIASIIVCAVSMFTFAQRVKEEYATSKKTVKAAISKGFRQSLIPTINLHVVAGIVSIALLIFANGVVKGFSITFGIGLAVSLISTLVFTRMFTSLILPLVKNKEKFLRFKREEVVASTDEDVTEA